MERKPLSKNDILPPRQPKKCFPFTHLTNPKTFLDTSQSSTNSMFCKYASSIIQVVPQQKIQKEQNQMYGFDYNQPIFEQSDICPVDYQKSKIQRTTCIVAQNIGYNVGASKNKQINNYAYSKIYDFCRIITKIINNQCKTMFDHIKQQPLEKQQKQYSTRTNIISKRNSLNSNYSVSTQQGHVKSLKYLEIRRKQKIQESVSKMVGWVEYKLLTLYNRNFSAIQHFASQNKDIIFPQASLKFQQNFSPSSGMFNNTNIDVNNEVSLAYTIDPYNYDQSEKQMTLTTPEKHPFKSSFKTQKQLNFSHFSLTELEDVEKTIFSKQKQALILNQCNAIKMPILHQRRYLTVRANLYELPLCSKNQFTKRQKLASKCIENKCDIMNFSGYELRQQNIDQLHSIKSVVQSEIRPLSYLLQSKTTSKKQSHTNEIENSNHSRETTQKSTKILSNKQIRYEYGKQTQKPNPNNPYLININQPSRQKSPQLQRYYFPGTNNQQNKIYQTPKKNQDKVFAVEESIVKGFSPYGENGSVKNLINSSNNRNDVKNHQFPQKVHYINENLIGEYSSQKKSYSMPKVDLKPFPKTPQIPQQNKPSTPYSNYYIKTPQSYQRSPQHHQNQNIQIMPNKYGVPLPSNASKAYQMNKQIKNNQFHEMINNYGVPQKIRTPSIKKQEGFQTERVPSRYGQPVCDSSHKNMAIKLSNQKQPPKVGYYSPDLQKNRIVHQQLIQPPNLDRPKSRVQSPQPHLNMQRSPLSRQYFHVHQKQTANNQIQPKQFNNNYYVSMNNTPIPQNPSQVTQRNRVIEVSDNKSNKSRPQSKIIQRPSRINIFERYDPLQSEIGRPQRSSISRNSSQGSRPKSLTSKLQVTLKKK